MEHKSDSFTWALSIRQPWATLLILGLKSIEIRRWTTPIRGRIYIHAGRIADQRPEGWSRVPEKDYALTNLRGGIIGAANLVECIGYGSMREFRRDQQLHLNEPSWFLPPRMFGLKFERPALVPFRAIAGQVKPFAVPTLPEGKRTIIESEEGARKKIVRFELESS